MEENARVRFATGLRRHLRIQPSLSIGALPANPGGERLTYIETRVLRSLLAIGTQPANPDGDGSSFLDNCLKQLVHI
jgi:hypothetical protein